MPATAKTTAPTPGQLGKIHSLKRALGLDEATYRAILDRYGAASSKDLRGRRIDGCLDHLERLAVEASVWKASPVSSVPRRRPGAASEAQVCLIQALWRQVSRQETDAARAKALDTFVKRITGKPKLVWCGQRDVEKLVQAMEAMGAKRE